MDREYACHLVARENVQAPAGYERTRRGAVRLRTLPAEAMAGTRECYEDAFARFKTALLSMLPPEPQPVTLGSVRALARAIGQATA